MTPSLTRAVDRLLPPSPTERAMVWATLVNTVGNGMFFTVSAIYFTRSVGLSPGQVGLGLSVAGLLGLLSGVPAGHLADVRGPRNLLVGLAVVEGAGVATFALVRGFWAFLVIASLVTVVDRAGNGVRNGLIAAVGVAGDRVRLRAYLRAVTNVGITVGAPVGGLALAVDTRTAYVAVILLNAATFLVAAALLLRVPPVPGRPHTGDGPRMAVLHDRPFVAITAVHAVLAMHFSLLDVALPLWIARRTSAPTWVVAAVLLVNTVCCVALQVRVSARVTTPAEGAVALRRSGLVIALACLVFAAAGGVAVPVAVVLLLAGALVHVLGELLQSAGGWAVSFGLAPEHQQGQYQGFFATGFSASSMLAPVALTALCVTWGRPGWGVLAGCFAVAGLAMVPLVARAEVGREVAALRGGPPAATD